MHERPPVGVFGPRKAGQDLSRSGNISHAAICDTGASTKFSQTEVNRRGDSRKHRLT